MTPMTRLLGGAALLLAAGCSGPSGLMSRVPLIAGSGRFMPESGEAPGLVRIGKVHVARGDRMRDYMGARANVYSNYGAETMATCDYTLGGAGKSLTIESYSMENEVAAAGIFHYHRGRKLYGLGKTVAVGVAGVLDTRRKGRSLYFYKQRQFVKLVYTGPDPVPDLLPLARAMAAKMPGTGKPPGGFEYLNVEGVDPAATYVWPGYTFNCDFLPTGIFAKAPIAGPIAEVFLIAHHDKKAAAKTAQNYRIYLEINGKDYAVKHTQRRRLVWQAQQPAIGRVIVTQYKKYVIGVRRPKTYAAGEAVLKRVVANIKMRKRR